MPRLDPEVAQQLAATPDTGTVFDALTAHRLGFGVFPLAPGRKGPLFPNAHKGEKAEPGKTKCTGQCGLVGHGAHDGTHDEGKIRRWWSDHPAAGIGGSLLQLVAFDVEFQHGGKMLDALPETRTHYSGRGNGNRHLIYAFEPGSLASKITQRNSWLPGVDIKAGRGAYLVLPPTLHEETGKPFTVGDENGGEFHILTDDEVRAVAAEAGKDVPGLVATKEVPAPGSPSPFLDTTSTGGLFAQSEAVALLLNPPLRGEGQTNDALTQGRRVLRPAVPGGCCRRSRWRRPHRRTASYGGTGWRGSTSCSRSVGHCMHRASRSPIRVGRPATGGPNGAQRRAAGRR